MMDEEGMMASGTASTSSSAWQLVRMAEGGMDGLVVLDKSGLPANLGAFRGGREDRQQEARCLLWCFGSADDLIWASMLACDMSPAVSCLESVRKGSVGL